MTTADQSDPNGELPDGNQSQGEDWDSEWWRQEPNPGRASEGLQPEHEEASQGEPHQPGEAAPPSAVSGPKETAPSKLEPNEPAPPKASGLLIFVAAFLAFGVLIAVGIVLMLPRENPSTATEPVPQQQTSPTADIRELGTVDLTAAGVKGHLTTKWDGKLGYNFLIEPDDPARQAAFALTMSNPPRPSSVRIQIKNSNGFVLCFQDVLLKFNPRNAAAISDGPPQPAGGRPLSARAAEERREREAELSQEEATEAEREHGRSIFQLNAGSNGMIESISSQGEIPCPQTLYEGMGYWSFLPDFPSPEEQADWLKQQAGGSANADLAPVQRVQTQRVQPPQVQVAVRQSPGSAKEVRGQAQQGSGRKRMPYKSAAQPDTYLMAGDDSIVEYDTSAGSIETRTGKVFSIDKAGTAARVIAGYDLPVKIHYSCDQSAACTLTQGSSMAVHAHLDK
jgi:hypothetical protein